jgi:class 3 adenylate cyclase
MDEPMSELVARISRLERANWRAKRTVCALAALLLATATLAAKAEPGTYKATMFELDDVSGHPLAVLGQGSKGPSLMFLDSAGKPMLQVGAAPDNCLQSGNFLVPIGQQRCAPGLFAFDQNGIPSRVSIAAPYGQGPRAYE